MNIFKKVVNESIPYTILISIILFNVLLVLGIMSMFFDDKDTIIAGILGFTGAILGGALTLIGVRLSILEGRRKDEIKVILKNLEYINHISNRLSEMRKEIPYEVIGHIATIDLFTNLHEDVARLSTSSEALVLGPEIISAIDDLGKIIVRHRIGTMTLKLKQYDEIFIPINDKIGACFTAIELKRTELTDSYQSL